MTNADSVGFFGVCRMRVGFGSTKVARNASSWWVACQSGRQPERGHQKETERGESVAECTKHRWTDAWESKLYMKRVRAHESKRKKTSSFFSLSVFVNLSHGIVGKPQRQKARNSSSLLIITGQAREWVGARGRAVSRRGTLRHISSQRCDPLFVWCAPLTLWESKAGRNERGRRRGAKVEWKCQRDRAVGKTNLPTTAVKICPLLYRGVPSSCPAACFSFLSAAKLILGHQFPEIIWATSKLLIRPMIMVRPSRAVRPRSTSSQCARNFFYCPCPQFRCHELCGSRSDLWISIISPPTSVVSSGHYAVYWVSHLSAHTPRVASLKPKQVRVKVRSTSFVPDTLWSKLAADKDSTWVSYSASQCLCRVRSVMELTCSTILLPARLWMEQSHCDCDHCCADMFVHWAKNHEYCQAYNKSSLALFQSHIYCDC